MIAWDPIYGRIEVPRYLERLIQTPEVRRLSQVRLLNSLSPSVSTLSEIRRYSHTLGVLHLSTLLRLDSYSFDERRAFAACTLIHDAGTPPFGHILEYHLREKADWSHERVIRPLLWRFDAPENRGQQIFAGRALEFARYLRSTDISAKLVEAIASKEHPLSALLFGTIDLDNLDNVARMSWGIGIPGGHDVATGIAQRLGVTREGTVLLPSDARELVRQWADLRRAVYEVLTFDCPTAAAQALLSDAIGTAIAEGVLDVGDWPLTDEALLTKLQSHDATKDIILQEYLGRLPRMLFAARIAGSLQSLGIPNRSTAKSAIEAAVTDEFPRERALAYVMLDSATFERCVAFVDPVTGEKWEEGEDSRSVVLYAFLRGGERVASARSRRALERVLGTFNIDSSAVLYVQFGEQRQAHNGQSAFNFSPQ